MPDVWFAIPTANADKCGATFARWKLFGYRTAALTDGKTTRPRNCDLHLHVARYEGYAASVNALCRAVLVIDPLVDWIVTGGDDVMPDPSRRAGEIAAECTAHFGGTLGVMEPTGDRHLVDGEGRCAAERVCIAPWMGRDWILRGYGGRGPLCEDYAHYFVDEDLARVTERLGLLWRRPELTQYHDHPTRTGEKRPYLDKAHAGFRAAKAIFQRREAAGFPGHEPLDLAGVIHLASRS